MTDRDGCRRVRESRRGRGRPAPGRRRTASSPDWRTASRSGTAGAMVRPGSGRWRWTGVPSWSGRRTWSTGPGYRWCSSPPILVDTSSPSRERWDHPVDDLLSTGYAGKSVNQSCSEREERVLFIFCVCKTSRIIVAISCTRARLCFCSSITRW